MRGRPRRRVSANAFQGYRQKTMFESTVVESRKQKVGIQRIMTLPVSVAIHVVVVVAVVVGGVWKVEFPTNSPAQVAQYSVASAPPPPPPPPPPPKAATVT